MVWECDYCGATHKHGGQRAIDDGWVEIKIIFNKKDKRPMFRRRSCPNKVCDKKRSDECCPVIMGLNNTEKVINNE